MADVHHLPDGLRGRSALGVPNRVRYSPDAARDEMPEDRHYESTSFMVGLGIGLELLLLTTVVYS